MALPQLAAVAMEDLTGKGVPPFLEIRLRLDEPTVGFVIGEPEYLKGLLNSSEVCDGISERGAFAVPVKDSDDVVNSDGPGVN